MPREVNIEISLSEGQAGIQGFSLTWMTTLVIFLYNIVLSVMTWCLYYLTKHPEVEEKILAELDKVLRDEDIKPQVALELKRVHFTPPNFKSHCFC